MYVYARHEMQLELLAAKLSLVSAEEGEPHSSVLAVRVTRCPFPPASVLHTEAEPFDAFRRAMESEIERVRLRAERTRAAPRVRGETTHRLGVGPPAHARPVWAGLEACFPPSSSSSSLPTANRNRSSTRCIDGHKARRPSPWKGPSMAHHDWC